MFGILLPTCEGHCCHTARLDNGSSVALLLLLRMIAVKQCFSHGILLYSIACFSMSHLHDFTLTHIPLMWGLCDDKYSA